MDEHADLLTRLCRICGRCCTSTRRQVPIYSCTSYASDLFIVFEISISNDLPSTHPTTFCYSCYQTISLYKKALDSGRSYNVSTVVFDGWMSHSDDVCRVCEQGRKCYRGGRPKKIKLDGRPPDIPIRNLVQHIELIAPPPLVPFTEEPPKLVGNAASRESAMCPLCLEVLNSPIELVTCGSIVCSKCCCSWLEVRHELVCPCCYEDHLKDAATIRPPCSLVLDTLSNISVACCRCKNKVPLSDLIPHLQSSCQYVPVEGVLQEILDNPVTEPLSPVESALQSHFVRRSLLLSPKKDVLVVKTSGKPLHLTHISQALVPTSSASHKTVKKRTKSLSDLRSVVSAGDTITQLSREVDSCTPEERAKLLEVISSQTGDFRVSISTKDALAMKTELNISWNKLRAMRRWLQMWKIDMSSESHMRVRANDLIGSNIHAEMVPLSFQHKDGGEVIKQAPIASIPHLWDRIVTVLEQNQSNGKLTWHNGVIPSEEIWIKLGGDKGGGTFKFCFQILNVAAPNSTDCTNVISLFEAADSLTNLRICLGQYIQQVADICTRIWRERRIRLFICGDYEFLGRIHGISGASGRHCCLWCLIISENLILQPGPGVQQAECRTIESLCDDHLRFMQSGGNCKHAKSFNNVIHQPFFSTIPLTQVCPPGLHITLGTFLRLFSLMEEECHLLDVKNALKASDCGISYTRYHEAQMKRRELMDESQAVKSNIQMMEELLLVNVSLSPEELANHKSVIESICRYICEMKKKESELATQLAKINSALQKEFHKEEGPFVKALDNALASFHVQRQAYYSGSFVGNHVHRALKVNNTATLCNSIVNVAKQHCPSLLCEVEVISQKYLKMFTLFQKCHSTYDKNVVTDAEINTLEQDINNFMQFYRINFPTATVTPKMHILEAHVVPFLRRWHIGFGYLGEQGIESIHPYFNTLGRTYNSIKQPAQKLLLMLKEHMLHVSPMSVAARPEVKHYSKKSKQL